MYKNYHRLIYGDIGKIYFADSK